ncbi:TonB-dependent receptor [bacterium]|nr:TonB-dependent receptor [bacterium]
MRQLRLLIFLALLLVQPLLAQRYTVSGYVSDQSTGETIIGVNIVVRGANRGAATDVNGFFQIPGLTSGRYTLDVMHIAYARKSVEIELAGGSIMLDEIQLAPKALEMNKIVITGQRSEAMDISMESGHREITPQAIRSIPASGGDVFRSLKYLPGIEGIDPFSPLISVRGSDPGGNLILLDGVPIYNPYHCVTSSGLFNLAAIKQVEMLVGGFGVEYGGRNASVLYITTREGNDKKLHGEIKPSTSSTTFAFDFPVNKNITMMVSGRAYYDLVSRFLMYSPNYLFDTNLSLNWKINSRNRLSLRYFHSRDIMDISMNSFMSYFKEWTDIYEDYDLVYKNRWRNQAATAILKTVINPNVYLKTQVSGSFFSSQNSSMLDFNYEDEESGERFKLYYRTDIDNKIEDVGAKMSLSLRLGKHNAFLFGGEYNRYLFGNEFAINGLSEGSTELKPDMISVFGEDKISLGPLMLRAGMRFSKYKYDNGWLKEPRISGVLQLPGRLKLKGAWGRYNQYIISINSQEYEMSQLLDYYYPLRYREPSRSIHYILGIDKDLSDGMNLAIDFYYKDLQRLYTFDYYVSELDIYNFADKLIAGTGKAWGIELLWKGNWRTFSGWVGYGYSRSTRQYPHIMDGQEFMFDYDRTHSFKAMIKYQLNSSLSYSSTLRVQSGTPKTLEQGMRQYFYYDPVSNNHASFPLSRTERKNNVRMPLYIRLDVGLQKRLRTGFGANLAEFLGADASYLNFTLGNVLFFHRNVLFYLNFGEGKQYGFGTNYMPEISMGYTVKF